MNCEAHTRDNNRHVARRARCVVRVCGGARRDSRGTRGEPFGRGGLAGDRECVSVVRVIAQHEVCHFRNGHHLAGDHTERLGGALDCWRRVDSCTAATMFATCRDRSLALTATCRASSMAQTLRHARVWPVLCWQATTWTARRTRNNDCHVARRASRPVGVRGGARRGGRGTRGEAGGRGGIAGDHKVAGVVCVIA